MYRAMKDLPVESQLPAGVSFNGMIDAILDHESKYSNALPHVNVPPHPTAALRLSPPPA
jgi:hypothetical protein